MKKLILSIMCLFIVATVCSCSNKSVVVNNKHEEKNTSLSNKSASVSSKDEGSINTVTNDVSFNIKDSKSNPLSDVKVVIINMNGDVIDVVTSDKNGHAIKKLTVPIDKRYYWIDPNEIGPRGTVTAIAFKEGYREQVLLEVPVSPAGSLQELYLNPIVAGERNEPDVQPGSSHHLEIISLVEKYSKYFKK